MRGRRTTARRDRASACGGAPRLAGAGLSSLLAGLALLAAGSPEPADGLPRQPVGLGSGPYIPGELLIRFEGERRERLVELPRGVEVLEAARGLRHKPGIRYAVPNRIAHAAGLAPFIPTDPGVSGVTWGWERDQWNFSPRVTAPDPSVRATGAWRNLIRVGHPGGAKSGSKAGLPAEYGVKVAVVDTGVAYRPFGCTDGTCDFRRSPDLAAAQFVRGKDFVDDDKVPLDESGHGTHVASTIGEQITTTLSPKPDEAVTGLAYGARIMPVRVLNAAMMGGASDVAAGIVWAAEHRAKVINLSLEFEQRGKQAVDECADIPSVCDAINFATERGALVVAAAGNRAGGPARPVAYPARKRNVLAVGATTEHSCLAAYSQYGRGIDLAAPGGGSNAGADVFTGKACTPGERGRPIIQYGLVNAEHGDYTTFGFERMRGTSMAAAHASAAAALVRASGVLGASRTPADLALQLKRTARDLPPLGADGRYGHGLLDAQAATEP